MALARCKNGGSTLGEVAHLDRASRNGYIRSRHLKFKDRLPRSFYSSLMKTLGRVFVLQKKKSS